MRYPIAVRGVIAALVVTVVSPPPPALADAPLTLRDVERLALAHAPTLAPLHAAARAAGERIVSDGQLADPTLTVGALNVPTDSFSLQEDDMTMLGIGLRQAFPPGDLRRLKSQRAAEVQTREQARLAAEQRNVRRQVRRAWLDLYGARLLLALHQEEKRLAQRDLEAAQSRYRAAQEAPRMVLRARSARARVHEREPMLKAQALQAQSMLARLTGGEIAPPAAMEDVTLPPLPATFDPQTHPEWLAAMADSQGMHTEAAMAREEYKPGYTVDVVYGVRQQRPDMITAQVGIDLPLFTGKRQDRRLAEREALAQAAQFQATDRRLDLQLRYETARAEYDALTERRQLYERELLPALQREAAVTVAGFGRDQTELREARMRALETRAELIRLRVEQAKTQAELLYLTGEPTHEP